MRQLPHHGHEHGLERFAEPELSHHGCPARDRQDGQPRSRRLRRDEHVADYAGGRSRPACEHGERDLHGRWLSERAWAQDSEQLDESVRAVVDGDEDGVDALSKVGDDVNYNIKVCNTSSADSPSLVKDSVSAAAPQGCSATLIDPDAEENDEQAKRLGAAMAQQFGGPSIGFGSYKTVAVSCKKF